MAATHDVDLLVVGGGCAGLSLARALAGAGSSLRTLLIEPRTDYVDDRTWCFWSNGPHDYRHLATRAWNAWRFSSELEETIQRSNGTRRYQCLRSISFYEDSLDRINATNSIRLATGTRVLSMQRNDTNVEVSTTNGIVRARYVVDTRPSNLTAEDATPMMQVFLGAEVEVDRDVFDTGVVGLMDGMSADELGFRFTYMLPFTERTALIEETRFSAAPVSEDALQAGLQRTLEDLGAPFEIVRSETGRLPMTAHRQTGAQDSRIVTAGIGGGAIRASTGYAFTRIQRWAHDCAAQLHRGGAPHGHPVEPLWRKAVDHLFLRVLRSQPELGPHLFMQMGKRLSAKTLVRFLSDDCRVADFVRVASVLPTAPFLRQLMRDAGA